jgi:hypothetical protein
MQAADGDVSKVDTCKAEASACHDAVTAARQEIHTAIRACASSAKSCFQGAAEAGMDARKMCGKELRSCVEMALPPPPPLPPCCAALKQCLSSTDDGGTTAREACFTTFHSCVEATLPPCMHELATCIDDRSEPPRACERQAEECRHYRFTHDGGLPPAAGGSTGVGGAPVGGAGPVHGGGAGRPGFPGFPKPGHGGAAGGGSGTPGGGGASGAGHGRL